jgi:hypothetical protein
MKLFGRTMRYNPKETAEARMRAVAAGFSLRQAAKIRAYVVTTEYDRFEKYRIVHGFFDVIKMHLVLGLGYFFRRMEEGSGAHYAPDAEKESV